MHIENEAALSSVGGGGVVAENVAAIEAAGLFFMHVGVIGLIKAAAATTGVL